MIKMKKETATYMRERGQSDRIQVAVSQHNISNPDNRITMSDFINEAVNEKLKKEGVR